MRVVSFSFIQLITFTGSTVVCIGLLFLLVLEGRRFAGRLLGGSICDSGAFFDHLNFFNCINLVLMTTRSHY